MDVLKVSLGYKEVDKLNLTSSLETIINSQTFDIPIVESWNHNSNIDIKIATNDVESKRLLYKLEQSKSLPKLSTFILVTLAPVKLILFAASITHLCSVLTITNSVLLSYFAL